MKTTQYQPKTGRACHCKPGQMRDNCPDCEGTGMMIDFVAIRHQTKQAGMTPLEKMMFADGFVRDPNCVTRWYAGHSGKMEPVTPFEIHVSNDIALMVHPYGLNQDLITIMRFPTVQQLNNYLERNGRRSEAAAAYSNSWD